MSFDKSLESFFLEDFHLRPRNCSTLVDKFTAMGLSDPIKLLQGWKAGQFDATWLRTQGNVHDEDVADVVNVFQMTSSAYELKNELQKIFDSLGWMVEGEQQVNSFCILYNILYALVISIANLLGSLLKYYF